MQPDIQKASLWKRFAAALLDIILVVVVATGLFATLAGWLGYDSHNAKVTQLAAQYEAEFGISYSITQEQWDAMPEAEQQAYQERVQAADQKLQSTPEDIQILMDATVMLLVIVTLGILVAMLLLEFVVPLLFKNGQTVGKKVFSLAVIRQDSVKIQPLQLFVRTMIGRFAIETMIPVCIAIMFFAGFMNLVLLILLAVLVIAEIACMIVTRNNCPLHDLMACTVVVDYSCQMIFPTAEKMQEHQKKLEAERESRQSY